MATSIGALRISTMCERCKTHLIAPEWSETINERETVHIWSCPICGNEFQTVDERAEPVLSDAELAEEFLPNLMVA
jgi:ribosomal protein L37AE/L43A